MRTITARARRSVAAAHLVHGVGARALLALAAGIAALLLTLTAGQPSASVAFASDDYDDPEASVEATPTVTPGDEGDDQEPPVTEAPSTITVHKIAFDHDGHLIGGALPAFQFEVRPLLGGETVATIATGPGGMETSGPLAAGSLLGDRGGRACWLGEPRRDPDCRWPGLRGAGAGGPAHAAQPGPRGHRSRREPRRLLVQRGGRPPPPPPPAAAAADDIEIAPAASGPTEPANSDPSPAPAQTPDPALNTVVTKRLVSSASVTEGASVIFEVGVAFQGGDLQQAALVDVYERQFLAFQSASAGNVPLPCEVFVGMPDGSHSTVVCDLGTLTQGVAMRVGFTALAPSLPGVTENQAFIQHDPDGSGPGGPVMFGPATAAVEIVEVLVLPTLGDGDVGSAGGAMNPAHAALALLLMSAAAALVFGACTLTGQGAEAGARRRS